MIKHIRSWFGWNKAGEEKKNSEALFMPPDQEESPEDAIIIEDEEETEVGLSIHLVPAGDIIALLVLAGKLQDLRRYKTVLKCYEKIVEIDPDFYSAWNQIGNLNEFMTRDQERALFAYKQALRIDPSSSYPWNNVGRVLMSLNHYQEAADHYRRAVEIAPEVSSYWTAYGRAFQALGKRMEAIACFERAIDSEEPDNDAFYQLGKIYLHGGRDDEAAKYLQVAAQHSRDEWIWDSYGTALFLLNRDEEALECFNKAVEFNPDYGVGWLNRGAVQTELKQFSEALESFDRAAGLVPPAIVSSVWYNRGRLLIEMNRHAEALESFNEGQKIDPNHAKTWLAKSIALEALGRAREAEESKSYYEKLTGNGE